MQRKLLSLRSRLRSLVLCTLCTLCAGGAASPAFAQDSFVEFVASGFSRPVFLTHAPETRTESSSPNSTRGRFEF